MQTPSSAPEGAGTEPEPTDFLPEEVAEAWAAVLIDIYEKRQQAPEGEHAEHRAAG